MHSERRVSTVTGLRRSMPGCGWRSVTAQGWPSTSTYPKISAYSGRLWAEKLPEPGAVMSAQRVALYLQDAHDLREGLDVVRYAEARGFEAVWQAESRLVRDAIVPMAAYAAVTERLKVGSGVINNWTRNIGLLAAAVPPLADVAPGRILCGIRAWWDPLAKNVGIDRRKPLQAMHETGEV